MRSPKLTRRSLGATSFLTLSFTLLLSSGCSTEKGPATAAPKTGPDAPTLYFSAIPDANKTELDEGYAKVAAHLSKELGVPVKFRPASDYSASVEAFKNGDIQLAWFGGVTGVQARRAVPGARAIAQGKVDPEYVSYFVANASTGIQPSDTFPMALAGKTFTFGPESSTSGRVMPEFFIREATKKSPADFFGHPNKHTKGHDFTAKEVEAGTVDAGVLSYAKYDDMVAKGQLDPAKCVKIWTTPPYPDYNWTAHPVLDKTYGAGFTDKLQKTLIGITDPELLGILLRKDGLISAKNEDFEPTDKTMASIGM